MKEAAARSFVHLRVLGGLWTGKRRERPVTGRI